MRSDIEKQAQSDFETVDRAWAGLLSPIRRKLLANTGLAALAATAAGASGLLRAVDGPSPQQPGFGPPPGPGDHHGPFGYHDTGKSPWGYATDKETTPRPVSVRPHEQTLPDQPRAYTDIKSYHAHFYFDEDSYYKAVRIRQWVADRFSVELGHWDLEPIGPHVTPSFYFGFSPEQLRVIYPWLQLNSLGLTILVHPNTSDPRSDHLYYAGWINRAQPVNAYGFPKGQNAVVEKIYPNTRPTLKVET